MVRQSTVLGVLMGLLSSMSTFAQDGVSDEQWLLAKYDVNGDQVISSSEVADKRKQAFIRMDFNQDGDVSFDEYEDLDKVRRATILKARFDKLDSDRDGILSGAEYSSYLGSFERLDQNQDGIVSQKEMSLNTEGKKKARRKEADLCLLWVCVRKNMR